MKGNTVFISTNTWFDAFLQVVFFPFSVATRGVAKSKIVTRRTEKSQPGNKKGCFTAATVIKTAVPEWWVLLGDDALCSRGP